MLMIETRRLSIELDNNYRRIGRFSLLIQRHPEYRPVGLFEIHGPDSDVSFGDHCWVVFAFGYRAELFTNAGNQWGVI